ncbi:cytochrome P450 [Actinoplanes sp. URMC 104]|uniref:cytochrome P450 n=1 Tax=Actinoplanes sp. URMC 104 TaxID=3423409 RepID=UPI003F1C7258
MSAAGRGRRRDRRVYLGSHPVLFALLAATRGRAALRLGGTVLVHDGEAYRHALTRVPLDRTAAGTTGGEASRLASAGALFDQQGEQHRATRRDAAEPLGAAGVAELRPIWTRLLEERLPVLGSGGTVDLVPLAAEMAGATAAALLGLEVDPVEFAEATRGAAAAAARAHLPGPGRWRAKRSAAAGAARLVELMTQGRPAGNGQAPGCPASEGATPRQPAGTGEPSGQPAGTKPAPGRSAGARTAPGRPASVPGRHSSVGLDVMLAVAAINTTVAALPRAAAWACDDDLWDHAGDPALVDELLRVTAPTPLLPRVAAASGQVGGCPVRPGDRLLLIARHAAQAHRRGPCPTEPAPARTAQLVFGAGPHACPGAGLAWAQLGDLLAALAPYRPVVVRARADRRAALPGWRSLTVRAGGARTCPSR